MSGSLSGAHGGLTEIRPLATREERQACVALQEEVWGEGFSERVPGGLIHIAVRVGGVAAGAFDDAGRLAGFVFGLTGLAEGAPLHWSHMLAVRSIHRGHGLGRRLKAYQRETLLAAGVTRARWTFDPLRARNAWLNFARLGAVATSYVRDMYADTDSPLHRGVGTDRLVVLWEMDAPRVDARMAGEGEPDAVAASRDLPRAFDAAPTDGGPPIPGAPPEALPAPPFLVPVPARLGDFLESRPEVAGAWREATRGALEPALEAGLRVTELVPLDDGVSALLVEAP